MMISSSYSSVVIRRCIVVIGMRGKEPTKEWSGPDHDNKLGRNNFA